MIFPSSFSIYRRKKKCIRYKEAESEEQREVENHVSDDNLGSCGSVDEAQTPEDDTESLNQSLSSPGCLSGLSSLQSPSTSLASPINLLASPSTPTTLHMHHDVTSTMMDMNIPPINGSNSSNSLSAATTSLLNNLSRKHEHYPFQQHKLGNLSPRNHSDQQSNNSPPTSSLSTTAIKNSMLKSNGSLTNTNTHTTSAICPMPTPSSAHDKSSMGKRMNDVQIKTEPVDSMQQYQQQQMLQQRLGHLAEGYDKMPIIRNPVGANPRDVNNPLSVNQLTKRDYASHNTAAYLALNINHALAAAAVAAQSPQIPPPPTIGMGSGSPVGMPTGSSNKQHPQHMQHQQHPHMIAAAAAAAQDIILGHPNSGFQSLAHNFHNLHAPLHYQLAAAAAAANQPPNQPAKSTGPNSSATHHRTVDDGNAISVT